MRAALHAIRRWSGPRDSGNSSAKVNLARTASGPAMWTVVAFVAAQGPKKVWRNVMRADRSISVGWEAVKKDWEAQFNFLSDLRSPRRTAPTLASRTMWLKSAEGGLDPFAEPSGADRCLRTADGRCGRQAAIAGCDDGRPSGAPAAREMISDHFDGATGRRGARRDPEPALRQTSALALEIVPDGQRLELGDEAQPLRRVRGNDRL